jgi:hypothetical protein
MKNLIQRIEDALVRHILTKRNVALVDPDCGCLRSPDIALSEPCPDPGHIRSTRLAFHGLDSLR